MDLKFNALVSCLSIIVNQTVVVKVVLRDELKSQQIDEVKNLMKNLMKSKHWKNKNSIPFSASSVPEK